MPHIKSIAVFGQDESDIVELPGFRCRLHRSVVPALENLKAAAADAGFDLQVASAYRGFSAQQTIWDAKARGERPVLDDCERPIDLSTLSDWQRVQAILRWSALPGASRHHWGSDLDIFDKGSLPAGYHLRLCVEETRVGGVMESFYQWLDQRLHRNEAFGFYRPYAEDRGGIAPEPWHLSYRPLAEKYQELLSPKALAEVIRASTIALRETVLEHLPEIYDRFVRCP